MGAEERWNGCEVVPANKLGYWERWDGRGGLLYGEYNIKDDGQLKRGGGGCSFARWLFGIIQHYV